MWNDREVDFQLKLHTLEKIILEKNHEIKTIQARLDSLSSLKIQSEDEILTLVAEVRRCMKNAEGIVKQIRQPCQELELKSLYDLVKNICCALVSSIRLLSEGFESGVERNLVKFRTQQKKQLQLTICTREQAADNKKIQEKMEAEQKKIKVSQYTTDLQIQMEIDRLYQHILAEKESVLRTSASNSFMKLNQVRLSWMKLMGDSDELLEEAFYRNIQQLRDQAHERMHKPEYLSKILKQEISQRLKHLFKQYSLRAIKKMHEQFYNNQYKKIKEQILSSRPQTFDESQQTDSDCLSKLKQVIKEKKISKQLQEAIKQEKRLTRQLHDAMNQKKQLNEEITKLNRINENNLIRIQELQRKLVKYFSRRGLQRKLSNESRRSTLKLTRNSSLMNEFIHEEKDFEKTFQENETMQRHSLLEGSQFSEITEKIKKKKFPKKINAKAQTHGQKFINLAQRSYQIDENISGQNLEDNLATKLDHRKTEKMNEKESQNMQKSLKSIQEQQYMNTMAEIMSLVGKISSQEKQRNSIKLQNLILEKAEVKGVEAMTEKALSNPEVFSIFQNFVKRIVSNSFDKTQQTKQKEQKKLQKPKLFPLKSQQDNQGPKLKEFIKKKSIKQPILTNNLLVRFLSVENQQHNHTGTAQKANNLNQKSEIQIYVENQVHQKFSKSDKNDPVKQITEPTPKDQQTEVQNLDKNKQNLPEKRIDLFKKFASSLQTKSTKNHVNIEGRFEKFHFNKPRLYTRQTKSIQKSAMRSFDMNARPNTKIQQRINTSIPNNGSNTDKLIHVQKMQPIVCLSQEQILDIIIQLCKNGKFEEVRSILSKNLGMSLRKMYQRQISKICSIRLIKGGAKYRMERLDTS